MALVISYPHLHSGSTLGGTTILDSGVPKASYKAYQYILFQQYTSSIIHVTLYNPGLNMRPNCSGRLTLLD